MSPSSPVVLASGQITQAVIMQWWPLAATVVDPRRLPATCNAVMRVLAAAVAKLAEIRAAAEG